MNIEGNGWKEAARTECLSEPVKRLCRRNGILILIGGCYAVFVSLTGWAVPCLFRKITGWLCPGCGITRACVKLLHGDIGGAFSCNPFLFFIAPFLIYLIVKSDWNYVKKNTHRLNRIEEAITYGLIVAALIYCVIRNTVLK